MLQRLAIVLAQFTKRNQSNRIFNLCWANEITKKVYDNIINSVNV